jgi:hypothetical protein
MLFVKKNISLKSLYLVKMSKLPVTNLQVRYTNGKIDVKNIRENKFIGSETGSGYVAKQPNILTRQEYKGKIYVKNIGFFLFMYDIQHCFICRPSDSTVSEDAGIGPRTVATTAIFILEQGPDPDPKPIEKSDPEPDPKKIIPDPQHCSSSPRFTV